MSRLSRIPDRAKAAIGALLLAITMTASACEEDSKTAPARCADPVLPIYDIAAAGQPSEAELNANPCVTKVGHSISLIGGPVGTAGATTGGTAGAAAGGKGGTAGVGGLGIAGLGGLGGKGGSGGTSSTDAGAGGA